MNELEQALSELTIKLDRGDTVTRQEVYTITMRALLRLRVLDHEIKVLQTKVNEHALQVS